MVKKITKSGKSDKAKGKSSSRVEVAKKAAATAKKKTLSTEHYVERINGKPRPGSGGQSK